MRKIERLIGILCRYEVEFSVVYRKGEYESRISYIQIDGIENLVRIIPAPIEDMSKYRYILNYNETEKRIEGNEHLYQELIDINVLPNNFSC